MEYEFKIGEFNGPLHKLLELIEEKKLTISEISLASVTDDFLKYLDTLDKVDFSILADFVSVASRLILIKSKSLLPSLELTEEEEKDIKDLEKRLIIYQELKTAKKNIQNLWNRELVEYSRPYLLGSSSFPVFSPGKIDSGVLKSAISKIFESLEKLTLETETIKEKLISLEEKITEIIGRVAQIGKTTLHKLAGGSRVEMIATFLAILHLARDQVVKLEQAEHFSDIVITQQ